MTPSPQPPLRAPSPASLALLSTATQPHEAPAQPACARGAAQRDGLAHDVGRQHDALGRARNAHGRLPGEPSAQRQRATVAAASVGRPHRRRPPCAPALAPCACGTAPGPLIVSRTLCRCAMLADQHPDHHMLHRPAASHPPARPPSSAAAAAAAADAARGQQRDSVRPQVPGRRDAGGAAAPASGDLGGDGGGSAVTTAVWRMLQSSTLAGASLCGSLPGSHNTLPFGASITPTHRPIHCRR